MSAPNELSMSRRPPGPAGPQSSEEFRSLLLELRSLWLDGCPNLFWSRRLGELRLAGQRIGRRAGCLVRGGDATQRNVPGSEVKQFELMFALCRTSTAACSV